MLHIRFVQKYRTAVFALLCKFLDFLFIQVRR